MASAGLAPQAMSHKEYVDKVVSLLVGAHNAMQGNDADEVAKRLRTVSGRQNTLDVKETTALTTEDRFV